MSEEFAFVPRTAAKAATGRDRARAMQMLTMLRSALAELGKGEDAQQLPLLRLLAPYFVEALASIEAGADPKAALNLSVRGQPSKFGRDVLAMRELAAVRLDGLEGEKAYEAAAQRVHAAGLAFGGNSRGDGDIVDSLKQIEKKRAGEPGPLSYAYALGAALAEAAAEK